MLRRRGTATFVLLVLVAEVLGRSATTRVDRALHVRPLAPTGADYYPFLLVGLKVVVALTLAALLARLVRAHAAAEAGERLLDAIGHRHAPRTPRLRPGLSPRVWLASFVSTSLLYLVHTDVDSAAAGRWALFAPWLHTYALPVFAAVSVLVAVAWRFARWLHEVEDYAVRTLARVRRLLTAPFAPPVRRTRPSDDARPRRRFGLAFESRPPPLPA
ncbi:MAG TPA: hypothetical protein VFB17_05650 [Gaiellaceae bacterium]|nr:hypothetical protein [Gaiellaceae bacterium]